MVEIGEPERSPTATWRSTSSARPAAAGALCDRAAADRANAAPARTGDGRREWWTRGWTMRHGAGNNTVAQGQELALKCLIQFQRQVEDPAVTLTIEDDEHHADAWSSTTIHDHERTGDLFSRASSRLRLLALHNVLAPDRYYATLTRRTSRQRSRCYRPLRPQILVRASPARAPRAASSTCRSIILRTRARSPVAEAEAQVSA